jgi:gliding motility-associated-like protein
MLKKLFAILMLVLLTGSSDTMASHIVGGDFTYVYLGDTTISGVTHRKYKVSLLIYQDCLSGVMEAIIQDNPAYFTLYENDGSLIRYDTNILYDATPGSGGSITVPANFSNDCVKNIPQLCLFRKRFEKIYYLRPSNVGYTVVYQRCCRNANIGNLVNPGDKGASYYCIIPRTGVTNNSAVFKNYPPQVICQSNPLYYDHSATDVDGDSLSYEFCPAEEGASGPDIKPRVATPPPFDTVDYYPPFNFSYCMPGFPPVQIDPRTGIISGTPNRMGRYLVTVCCTEWRNGSIINVSKREFQFVVTDCSKVVVADIPQLSDAPNTYIVNCRDFKVHFINKSTGGFSYKWDFGVEGSAGSTEFEPDFVYPDTGTYVVKLIVNPSTTCPDSISRFVKIYPVFRSDFDDTGIYCPGLPITFLDKSVTTIKPVTRWSWDFGDGTTSSAENPVHTYKAGGTYNVVFSGENIKNCVDTTIRRVVIQDFKPFAGDDTIIVKGEYIQFDAKGGTSYAWMPDINLSDTSISNPIGTYPDTGTYIYRIFVKSSYGCSGYDTMRVLVVPSAYFTMPTAFTPNGDGKNDLFRPKAVGYKTLKYFKVYNRFGQEVFYGQSIEDGWDGTWNGKPADIGVYFWHICYVDRFGNDGFTKGDVTLIR